MIKEKLIWIYNEKIFPWYRMKKFRNNYRFDVMDFYQTIDYIKKKKCSISRYGDGEFGLILKSNNPDFQNKNIELEKRLADICETRDSRILVCIPHSFISTNDCNDFAKKFWDWWIWDNDNIIKVANLLGLNRNTKVIFGDAQITRPYMDWKDKSQTAMKFNLLKSLWDDKDILIVEGENTKLGVGNDLFSQCKSIRRILCPSKNAFDKYDKILACVKKYADNRLVIIALGPTATVLAYDLGIDDIQSLDIGHIDIEYEWFLQGATTKQPVLGKEVQEVHDNDIVSIEDQKYITEIILKIK